MAVVEDCYTVYSEFGNSMEFETTERMHLTGFTKRALEAARAQNRDGP